MWIRLKVGRQINNRYGEHVMYHAGDWVDIGKHDGLRLIAEGTAEDYAFQLSRLDDDCGVVSQVGDGAWADADLGQIVYGEPMIPFPRTAIINSERGPRTVLLHIGFNLLEKWECAAPIASYETLACNIGTDGEREMTARIIHDLRVPYYDSRLVFVRDCETGRELVKAWRKERKHGLDQLAFLRAVYQVKPIICALPVTWSAGL